MGDPEKVDVCGQGEEEPSKEKDNSQAIITQTDEKVYSQQFSTTSRFSSRTFRGGNELAFQLPHRAIL